MCDFPNTLIRHCAVCAGGYGSPLREEKRALSTLLQNFASAAEFLASFDLVTPSAAECDDVDLCNFCLSTVLTCDNVLSLFWRKIAALRDLKSVRISCELESRDTEVVSFFATTDEPPAAKRRRTAIRKSISVAPEAVHSRTGPPETPQVASNRSTSNDRGNVAEVNALVETAGTPEGSLLRHVLLGGKRVDEISQDLCGSPPPLPVAVSGATEDEAAADSGDSFNTDCSGSDGDEDDDFNRMIPSKLRPKREHRILAHRVEVSNCGALLRVCEECGLGCSTKMQLYRHFNRHHAKPDAFRCWECGRRFLTQEQLGNHEEIHWKEHFGNATCIDCRKEIRPTSVKMHVDRAHGGRLNRTKAERESSGRSYTSCFYCKYVCCSDSRMELHVLQAHPGEGDGTAFQCDECPKKFKETQSLIKHKHFHRMETHACPHCPKTFRLRSSLTQHVRSHTGAKQALCPECGKRLTKDHMPNHMATEHGVGEVKYRQCHLCPARYKSPKSYKIHLASEHQIGTVKEKTRHGCDQCGKTYSLKECYLAHMFREHGVRLPGFKEYPCVFCDRVCLSSTHYNAHMQKVHGQNSIVALKPLLCKLCSASCPERKQFMEHLKLVHDISAKGKNLYKKFLLES